MITLDFLQKFKNDTELSWSKREINTRIYGFQIQQHTKWLPGLSDTEISEYEFALGFSFPNDMRAFLHFINGVDKPQINIYGNDGTPNAYAYMLYSYPRDLEAVKQMISYIEINHVEIPDPPEGVELKAADKFLPIYSHRYVLCSDDPKQSTVLSIHGADAIVYGKDLQSYLLNEFSET